MMGWRRQWRSGMCCWETLSLPGTTCYTTSPAPQARWAASRDTCDALTNGVTHTTAVVEGVTATVLAAAESTTAAAVSARRDASAAAASAADAASAAAASSRLTGADAVGKMIVGGKIVGDRPSTIFYGASGWPTDRRKFLEHLGHMTKRGAGASSLDFRGWKRNGFQEDGTPFVCYAPRAMSNAPKFGEIFALQFLGLGAPPMYGRGVRPSSAGTSTRRAMAPTTPCACWSARCSGPFKGPFEGPTPS